MTSYICLLLKHHVRDHAKYHKSPQTNKCLTKFNQSLLQLAEKCKNLLLPNVNMEYSPHSFTGVNIKYNLGRAEVLLQFIV